MGGESGTSPLWRQVKPRGTAWEFMFVFPNGGLLTRSGIGNKFSSLPNRPPEMERERVTEDAGEAQGRTRSGMVLSRHAPVFKNVQIEVQSARGRDDRSGLFGRSTTLFLSN